MKKSSLVAWIVTISMVSNILGILPAKADHPLCTITVTQSNATIQGTSLGDVICVTGDNNFVNALRGDDIVVDEGVGNTINLGEGFDSYLGTGGDDAKVDGGAGNDTITGTPGLDVLVGGEGDDALIGGEAEDTLTGGSGNDNLSGGEGNDSLFGLAGDDTITGDSGNDSIDGGEGIDSLEGSEGDDSIIGGLGNDSLSGDVGADQLAGSAGNDILVGGTGLDNLDGGDGMNQCDFTDGETLTRTCTYDTKCDTGSGSLTGSAGPSAMSRDGRHIAVICGMRVYLSHDSGTTWLSANWATEESALGGVMEMTISDDGQKLNLAQATHFSSGSYAWGGSIISSRDGGLTWEKNLGPGEHTWWGLSASGDGRVIVATHISNNPSMMTPDGMISLSQDYGVTWKVAPLSNSQFWGSRISADGTTIVVASWSGSLWKSSDSGDSWTQLSWSGFISGLAMDDSGQKIAVTNANGCILNISKDGGQTFTIPSVSFDPGVRGSILGGSITFTGDGTAMLLNIPAASPGWPAGVYYSLDSGDNWTKFYEFYRSFGAFSTTADGTKTVVVDGAPPTALITVFSGIPNNSLPGQVQNVSARSVTSSGLILSWDSPIGTRGLPIADYKVQVSKDGGKSWIDVVHKPATTTSFTVNGLRRKTRYEFRVAAVKGGVTGLFSIPIPVTTAPDVPAAPSNLVTSELGASTVELQWSLPIDNGGAPINDYKIETSRDGQTWRVVPHSQSTVRLLKISGLAPGTVYQVRLSAINSVGPSSYHFGTFKTQASAPLAPTGVSYSLLTDTTLMLTWQLPQSNGGSKIMDYKVEVSSGCKTFTAISRLSSASLGFKVTGLSPGTKYCFRVSAKNEIGYSSPSTAIELTTVGNPPSAPLSLSIKVSGTSVQLSWNASEVVKGSAVRNYIVEYSKNNGSTWVSVNKPPSTSRTVTISGLKAKTTYLLRVIACNDVGSSPASKILKVTTE